MIAKASGRPGHGRRRTRGGAKKQSGRRRAIRSVFARRCACSDGTRSDRRPRFPAAAFDNERPPSALNARPVARRKEEKKPSVRPQDVDKARRRAGRWESPQARKFAGGEICRQGVLPGLDRQKRSPSATCKPGQRPATGFDDPEGPGSSAGGKQNLHPWALPWTQVAAGCRFADAGSKICLRFLFIGANFAVAGFVSALNRLSDRRMLTKPADWQGVGKARKHGNLPAAKFVARAFCRALIVKNGRHRRLASRARDLRPGLTIPKGRAAPPAGSQLASMGASMDASGRRKQNRL